MQVRSGAEVRERLLPQCIPHLVAHALEFVRSAYFLSVDEHAELLGGAAGGRLQRQTVIIAARSASNNAYHSRSVLLSPAPDAAGWRAFFRKRDTKVGDLCAELGVTRQTLYRFGGNTLLKSKVQHDRP